MSTFSFSFSFFFSRLIVSVLKSTKSAPANDVSYTDVGLITKMVKCLTCLEREWLVV